MKTAEELANEKYYDIPYPENIASVDDYTTNEIRLLQRIAYVAGYSEAMLWRDPKEELPELLPDCDYSNNVLAKVEGFTETQVMCLLFVFENEGGWGYVWANCYGDINGEAEWDDDYEVVGWKPIE